MANPISKKLKYINKNGEEKEITLYDNPASFSDYDGGNYIAVQADTNTVGYIYCNSKLPKGTTTHFASFIDKNNKLRYAYTEELIPTSITYTFTAGYDVMPKINGVVYSSKYEDTINENGTTTRTLLSDEPITQISFNNITNNSCLLSFDECYGAKLTTCANMFSGCSGLTSINLSNFDTSNVTDMSHMFSGCSGLTSLNLSNFDTSKVTNMSSMFSYCKGLTSLNLSNFNTSRVTIMSAMFSDCSGLTSLNLSNFNTSNVTDMSAMFKGCSGLRAIDLFNFNTSNVTDVAGMFRKCTGLTSLNLSNFNTSNVAVMSRMFEDCNGLTSLNLSNFNTSNVTSMSYMFNNCSGLTSLDIRSFSSIKLENYSYMLKSVNSKCKVYVNKNKFTKTELDCKFTGSFTHVT